MGWERWKGECERGRQAGVKMSAVLSRVVWRKRRMSWEHWRRVVREGYHTRYRRKRERGELD